MKFEYKIESNIEMGQVLYGIIAVSRRTYNGVYRLIVDEIDWNKEEVVFKIEQPCSFVSCDFFNMNKYVFESELEAKENLKKLDYGEGLFAFQ